MYFNKNRGEKKNQEIDHHQVIWNYNFYAILTYYLCFQWVQNRHYPKLRPSSFLNTNSVKTTNISAYSQCLSLSLSLHPFKKKVSKIPYVNLTFIIEIDRIIHLPGIIQSKKSSIPRKVHYHNHGHIHVSTKR